MKGSLNIAMIGVRALGYPAGIDHHVTELTARLAEKGHTISVYCQAHCVRDGEIHPKVRIVKIPTFASKYLGTPVYGFLSTIAVLFRRYDVVHYHGLGSAIYSFLPRIFGKRVIVTIHALDWEGKKWGVVARGVLKLAGWGALHFPNQTTVVSRTLQRHFQDGDHAQVQCIPNGVGTPTFRMPELIRGYQLDQGSYILSLGRLAPGKGLEYLISAFQKLTTDLKLVIAGDAITEHEYVNKLKKTAGSNVLFTGWAEGAFKEELLSNAYLFVLPSELEGMSGVLLEAMSYKRCVVVSDIPQNLEVIGNAGFSFKNRNVQALRDILASLVLNSDLVARTGNLAYERVLKEYHWDQIVRVWEDTYKALAIS